MIPTAIPATNVMAIPFAVADMAGLADDLEINQIAMQSVKARAEARELQDLVERLTSQLPDDELPQQIARARDQATTSCCLAERIEGELSGAKTDPRTGKKQISHYRVAALGQELKQMQHAVEEEKGILLHAYEEATAHKAEAAHTAAASHETTKVVVIEGAKEKPAISAKSARKAAKVAAAAGGGAHVMLTPVEVAGSWMRTRVESGVSKVKHAAKQLVAAVEEIDIRHTVTQWGEQALNFGHEQVALRVQHAYHQATEMGNDAASWVSEKTTKLIAWRPWGEKKEMASTKPVQKCDGLMDCAKQRAAALLVPLALEWQDVAHHAVEFVPQSLPKISAVLSHLPGVN